MLSDGLSVVKRVGVLLDDPANSVYTQDYVLPFVDQASEEMDAELQGYSLQYLEQIAVFPVDAGVSDLSPLLADSQPLAFMKYPKAVDWKLPSEPDENYQPSEFVDELDDVDANSVGALEWRNANGSIQVTPSSTPVVLRVYFDGISTSRWDPQAQVIRGTGHILALRVARDICGTMADLQQRMPYFERRMRSAWETFIGTLVQQKQSQNNVIPRIHTGLSRPTATAGGQRILL